MIEKYVFIGLVTLLFANVIQSIGGMLEEDVEPLFLMLYSIMSICTMLVALGIL